MIGALLTKKVISTIAYTIVGSEVVRKNLTVENAKKVASTSKRIAARAGHTIKTKAGSLKNAVNDRRKEILAAKDELVTKDDDDNDEDSLI